MSLAVALDKLIIIIICPKSTLPNNARDYKHILKNEI